MINKNSVELKIDQINRISKKYSMERISNEIEKIKILSDEFKVNLLMIGGFSSGKSALLNKLIGRYILEENITPETALATELYFSENERTKANLINGEKLLITSTIDLHSDEVKNLELYIKSENLKSIPDYIIVDTPGFDSGIENHNKALLQYIDNGTAYFLVVDCEKGTLSESTLKFLREIHNYSSDIAVIINKIDKKTENEVSSIKEHIKELLLSFFGCEFPVICTSIREDEVDKKILDLIKNFNPQSLYEKNIGILINSKIQNLIDALILIKKSEKLDTVSIDNEIENREIARKKLIDRIEMQRKKIKDKVYGECKINIIKKIENSLYDKSKNLANSYKGGTDLFQREVVEIVRPIMISEMKEYSESLYENFLSIFDFENTDFLESIDFDSVNQIIQSIYDKLKTISNNEQLSLNNKKRGGFLSEGNFGTYKAISSIIAVATEIIAAPLELLIIFLPDVFKLFNLFSGKSKEQQLTNEIENCIIPEIVSKIKNSIDSSLQEMENIIFENIQININEMLDIESEALENAKQMKNDAVAQYENYIREIDLDIEMLRGEASNE